MKAPQKVIENASKIAYIVKEFPEKTLAECIEIWQMPGMHVNTAIWYAVEQGWIAELNKETGKLEFLKAPKWQFGEVVNDLCEILLFAASRLAQDEIDLEDEQLAHWLVGYAPHDVLVATKWLVETGKLTTYEIADHKDKDSVYTFYSLPENAEHKWGRKMFKEDPIAAETAEVPDHIPSDLTNKSEDKE